ncbi:hypothetical protein TcasGA2_TC014803 [Tribolium castaneum]|uniref:Uncharacterized protein n=1 Tax=Tribolium castaneum TaxID=7070 RepID=D6WJU0_TRICA|nr:hypothetical protein TcasGA2_TC014803 [Tribolium castaneum]
MEQLSIFQRELDNHVVDRHSRLRNGQRTIRVRMNGRHMVRALGTRKPSIKNHLRDDDDKNPASALINWRFQVGKLPILDTIGCLEESRLLFHPTPTRFWATEVINRFAVVFSSDTFREYTNVDNKLKFKNCRPSGGRPSFASDFFVEIRHEIKTIEKANVPLKGQLIIIVKTSLVTKSGKKRSESDDVAHCHLENQSLGLLVHIHNNNAKTKMCFIAAKNRQS